MDRKCSVEGCEGKYHCRGYCQRHYYHVLHYGKILTRVGRTPNDHIIEDGQCKIGCYNQKFVLVGYAIVAVEDSERCKPHKWYMDVEGYVKSTTGGKLHNFILGVPSDVLVDHINRNPKDNRRSNLRVATVNQNTCNSKISSLNKTGYRGVFKHQRKSGTVIWIAHITHNGKQRKLGMFKTAWEAALRYNEEARLLHGEFAYQNVFKRRSKK